MNKFKKNQENQGSKRRGFKYYFTVFLGKTFGSIVFDFLKENVDDIF
ncbi:hypothetical protein [Aureivirga sp. CE67]|nr:hypothetical protein [Aureivirga sp. CE67]